MRFLPHLFENNRAWAARRSAEDPLFFERLARSQDPDHLWIGCADSRVPANEIVGLDAGELFVHRNVANVVAPDDPNGLSVLHYAVDALEVDHVIVCGHYGCGGVLAALEGGGEGVLSEWLAPVRAVLDEHRSELDGLEDPDARWRRLCELNVVAQVRTVTGLPSVRKAWERGRTLTVHGWIYDVADGLLRDLGVSTDG